MDIYDEHPLSRRQIDENYYKEQILELRNSPNVINDLFIKWKSRFKSRQERAMLRELEEWYNSVKTLSGAQADALMERMRAQDARIDFDTSNTEAYRGERKETKILTLQAENEDLRARIAEAKRRQGGPKEEPAGKEPQKPKKMTEEDVRKQKVKRFHTVADDEIAMDEAQAKKLRELDERESKEVGEVENNPNLSEVEKQRRLQEIDARYLNLRKKILTTPGGRT